VKARSLVFGLFGDFLRYRGGEVRLRGLIALMGCFDVPEPTVRVIVARLRKVPQVAGLGVPLAQGVPVHGQVDGGVRRAVTQTIDRRAVAFERMIEIIQVPVSREARPDGISQVRLHGPIVG